ncbi:MAG: hypothetical protein F6K09_26725 [Merismopedia sp. SIO2A8]|nr:hypothetical protein [Symploca sp. SIO2B6]NET52158.1 hypothetical protein [Merismopedia sp. SIO2A8]
MENNPSDFNAELPQDNSSMKQDNRNHSTGIQAKVTGGTANIAKTIHIYEHKSSESEPKKLNPPQNLPHSGVSKFVGRSTELETLQSGTLP